MTSLPSRIESPAVRQGMDHGDLIARWLASLDAEVAAGQRSAFTVTSYTSSMRAWRAWLDLRQIVQPEPEHITAFLIEVGAGSAPATRNRHLHALRSCYRWAETQGLYPAIARSARSVVVHRDDPLPCYTRDQVEALLAAAGHPLTSTKKLSAEQLQRADLVRMRDVALVRVLFGTGVRLVSLVRSDVADLDLAVDPPVLRHQPKGHRAADATALLAPATAASLEAYLARRRALGLASAPLWISLHGKPGLRLTSWSMRRIITAAAERAGLATRDTNGHLAQPRTWGPHALRRSAATIVADAFGLEASQALMGHQSIDTTRRAYVRTQRYRMLERARHALDLPGPPA